jgi:tetratricopeptide (TPR) repeat protein
MTIRSLAFVATLLFAAQANATPRNTAKAHIDKAMKAHKEGKFDVALDELKAAYALDPKPDLLFAIAQVYVKLDKCADAITYYDKFLAVTKDAQAKQVVTQAVDTCKAKLATTEPPKQDPIADPPKQDPPKQDPPKQDPPKQDPPKDPKPDPLEHVPPPKDDSPFISGRSEQPKKSPFYKDVLGDVLVVAGIAGGAVGLVEYSSARSGINDAKSASTSQQFNDRIDSAHSKRNVAVIVGSAGIALATVGVIHWVMHGKKKETSKLAVIPTESVDGGYVTWLGRF